MLPRSDAMELTFPNYSGGGIFNLSQTIKESLDLNRRYKESSLVKFSGKPISLVVIDGLGYDLALSAGAGKDTEMITSVFPSVTCTALTTLMSGEPPGEHAMLGDTTFVRKLGAIISNGGYKTIYCDTKDSLTRYMPIKQAYDAKNIIAEATSNGKKCAVVCPYQWENAALAGLTASTAGDHFFYHDIKEAFSLYNESMKRNYDFIYFYIPYVDAASHKYGPESDQTVRTATDVLDHVTRLSNDYRKKINTIVTADHGHIKVDKWINLAPFAGRLLGNRTIPPFGSSRSLFINRAKIDDHEAKALPEGSAIFKATDGNLRRLLGSTKCMNKTMFTDIVAAASTSSFYIYPSIENGAENIVGDHGGLTSDEMTVPCIVIG